MRTKETVDAIDALKLKVIHQFDQLCKRLEMGYDMGDYENIMQEINFLALLGINSVTNSCKGMHVVSFWDQIYDQRQIYEQLITRQ